MNIKSIHPTYIGFGWIYGEEGNQNSLWPANLESIGSGFLGFTLHFSIFLWSIPCVKRMSKGRPMTIPAWLADSIAIISSIHKIMNLKNTLKNVVSFFFIL